MRGHRNPSIRRTPAEVPATYSCEPRTYVHSREYFEIIFSEKSRRHLSFLLSLSKENICEVRIVVEIIIARRVTPSGTEDAGGGIKLAGDPSEFRSGTFSERERADN